jgi:hypothetical protein
MLAVSATSKSIPHTIAWLAFEKNLDSINHMMALQLRELAVMKSATTRAKTSVTNATEARKAPDRARGGAVGKHLRSIRGSIETLNVGIDRITVSWLWQVVMLVTCVDAYLQDVLCSAASVDSELMSKSEHPTTYADVVAALSLEELASGLRARWARGWVSDGGPTRWISRLTKMGARGYSDDLAHRLERIWGIRHVVVHSAGAATAEFVKRHPGVVAGHGDRVRVMGPEFILFVQAVHEFTEPTEAYFLARYPSLRGPGADTK